MKKKHWKARAKRAERELRDQKAINAALTESVKRLKRELGLALDGFDELMDNFDVLRERHDELAAKHRQLQREYDELTQE